MDSWLNEDYRLEELMPLIRECLDQGKTVRFFPRGTSMLPMLRQGIDSVILAPLPEKLSKYDLPLYQRSSGQYVLHRIVHAGQTITCIGDNQFEKETGLLPEQMIAVAVGFTRNGKEHSVSEPLHRIYCRFWHYSRPLRRIWRLGKGWLRRHRK